MKTNASTRKLTEQAIRLVGRAVPGSMPDVEVVVTTQRGMADLMAAAYLQLANVTDRQTACRAVREARRAVRDVDGCAVPRAADAVLIVIDAGKHPSAGDFAVTLVHELVHAVQFGRRGVRDRIVRNTRDAFGVERQTSRQAREHERRVLDDEREAYRFEYLADQLVPGAQAA